MVLRVSYFSPLKKAASWCFLGIEFISLMDRGKTMWLVPLSIREHKKMVSTVPHLGACLEDY
jgi:hypothetical protein